MRILALDPSTQTGLAIVDKGNKVMHKEQIEFKKLAGFERVSAILGRVLEVKALYKPDIAVLEEMIVFRASTAIPIIQIGTMLRYALWLEDFPYREVGPTALKKWVCKDGTAKKEQMMMNLYKHWGIEAATNNICDAICLGLYAHAHPQK